MYTQLRLSPINDQSVTRDMLDKGGWHTKSSSVLLADIFRSVTVPAPSAMSEHLRRDMSVNSGLYSCKSYARPSSNQQNCRRSTTEVRPAAIQCRNCSRDPDHAHLRNTHSSQDKDFTWPTRVQNLKSLALAVAEILHGVKNSKTGWRRVVVVGGVRRTNEVNPRRARLLLGWVTVFGRVHHLRM